MTTQVIFNLDRKLKEKAMRKADSQGLPFGSVLKLATQAFVDGTLEVGIFPREEFNAKTRKKLEKIDKDIKEGKNLSPGFKSVKAMRAYLEGKSYGNISSQ